MTSTILHVAVESRQPAILHVLLTHLMANYGVVNGKGSLARLVNATDKHGSTPAHLAAGAGCKVRNVTAGRPYAYDVTIGLFGAVVCMSRHRPVSEGSLEQNRHRCCCHSRM